MGGAADGDRPVLLGLHGLDEHLQRLADPLLGALGGELLGELGDVGEAFGDGVRVQLVLVADRFGALLVGVPEDADGVEPGAGEETLQLGEVGLRLAGEADDEVGPGAGLRGLGADGVQELQEAVRVAEAAHGAQHAGGGVLEGQVEVRGDLRRGGQDVDQAGAHLGGLEVADPDALDAVDVGELGQQGLQQPDVAEVLAVRGVVLGDQHDLLDALLGQPAGLAQHVGGAAGDEGAAEGRDGAEGAPAVAAGGQLHRGDGAGAEAATERGARPGDRSDAFREVGGGRSDLLRVPGQGHRGVLPFGGADREELAPVARGVRGVDTTVEDGLEPVGDVGVVVESEDSVRLRQGLGEVLAVALGHTADRDDGLGSAVILQIVGFEEGIDGVLLGGFDEAAGVDDGDIRVGGVLDELPAVRCQAACKLLRVHLVTGAAKSDEGDGTAFGHGIKTTLSRRASRRAGFPATQSHFATRKRDECRVAARTERDERPADGPGARR